MKFEELDGAKNVVGVIDGESVTVLAAAKQPSGLILVFFQTADGPPSQTFLTVDQLEEAYIAEGKLEAKFNASAEDFKLAHEAFRMQLGLLPECMV